MRIICPTCSSHYEVAAEKIEPKGQLVRCAQCREVWLVRLPEQTQAMPVAAPAPDATPAEPAPAAPPPRDRSDVANAVEPIDFHGAKIRLRRRAAAVDERRARGSSLGTLAIGAVVLASAMSLSGFRGTIVRHVPAAGAAYAAIGLPVNVDGLALRDVRSSVVAEGEGTVLTLEGRIANLRDRATPVPALTVVVRGETDVPLYTWTAQAPKSKLERGETVAFRSRLAAPPAAGRNVQVTFADATPAGVEVGGH